ncbi:MULTISPECIES: CvpA family protein [unclassified Sphingobacterium]|uniref:CvpA family protein n=1 Tax=unclassified Sphingobacterium TaxID=2609468 RepID=UPI0020C52867|nr:MULTISPECIES: CvpA family protein [unclassified Sphingobacterium]
MVKKSVLEKLSDKELEGFIQPGSRKVPEAKKMAYEILVERGRMFSEEEKIKVESLIEEQIQTEYQEDLTRRKAMDKQLTDDQSAVALYTNFFIFVISIIFGVLYGFILAMINYIILKKYGLAFLLLAIGITAFSISSYFIGFLMTKVSLSNDILGFIVGVLVSAFGLAIISLFNKNFIPKDLEYRSRSILIPTIICIGLYILINFYK